MLKIKKTTEVASLIVSVITYDITIQILVTDPKMNLFVET